MKTKEIKGHEMHDLRSIKLPRLSNISSSILISIHVLQLSSSFYFKEIWGKKN
jgi:hypothetical protein